MLLEDLQVDRKRLAEICERYGVARLEVFGSFTRGDADAGSDIDVMVTFGPDAPAGLAFVSLHEELEALFDRPVDLLTRDSVEHSPNKYFRHFALRRTEPIYERA